jgi:hypothetical protein
MQAEAGHQCVRGKAVGLDSDSTRPSKAHPLWVTWRLMMSPMSRNRTPGRQASIATISASWVAFMSFLLASSIWGGAWVFRFRRGCPQRAARSAPSARGLGGVGPHAKIVGAARSRMHHAA